MKLFRLITVVVLLGGVFTACGGGDDPTQVFTPPPPPPPPPPPTGPAAVTFSLEAFALAIGDVLELSVDVTDASGGTITAPTVTWETSHATAITVTGAGTSATVEAVGAGSATITATSESVSGTSDGDAVASALFGADVQPIFTMSCAVAGCHTGPDSPRGMDLTAGVAFGNIVGVNAVEVALARIEPGDPTASYLIHKILGTQGTVGGSGQRMPLGGTSLTKGVIDIIRAWTQGGANNN